MAEGPYLNRSSNAFRAPSGRGAVVSRSTVVRAVYNAHEFFAFFGEIRAGIDCMHSNRLPGSNDVHCEQACRKVLHRVHRLSSPTSAETTVPHCAQRTTSR